MAATAPRPFAGTDSRLSPESAVAMIVIGMAGSGKTTLMQRLNAHLHTCQVPAWLMNLDPAVLDVPFGANVDIRDTVNYKEVMSTFGLGPNGGILTSLNLFSTRFDQVLELINKRKAENQYILVDTPGQIEIFTWSASGAIITEALASELPSVVLYVVDTPRSLNPVTFQSNMLYACSVLYKTQLPVVLVFNKIDVADSAVLTEWMGDPEAYAEALESDESYMSTLTRSMSLVLQQFYKTIRCVSVSAATGEGIRDLFDAVYEASVEFETDYRPLLEKKRAEMEANKRREAEREASRKDADHSKLAKDLEEDGYHPAPGPFVSSSSANDEQEMSSSDEDLVEDDPEGRTQLAGKFGFAPRPGFGGEF